MVSIISEVMTLNIPKEEICQFYCLSLTVEHCVNSPRLCQSIVVP